MEESDDPGVHCVAVSQCFQPPLLPLAMLSESQLGARSTLGEMCSYPQVTPCGKRSGVGEGQPSVSAGFSVAGCVSVGQWVTFLCLSFLEVRIG